MGIPPGKAGTLTTLKLMRRIARDFKKSPVIRRLALKLVENNHQKDFVNEVKSIHEFVRDNIRYVKDINGVETVQTPIKTLEFKQGDCDDKSTLAASLLESIGHPTRFVAVGFHPGKYAHVYVETKIGTKWVPVETTEPWPLGRTISNPLLKMVVHNR